jgi:hypothetical protein
MMVGALIMKTPTILTMMTTSTILMTNKSEN